jgi:hypothetical protein
MTLAGWLAWFRVELLSRPGRLVLMVLCVVASVTIAALVLHVIAWLRFDVRPEVERLFPRQRIIVEPAAMDVAFLRLQAGSLNDETVDRLRRMEGVAAVHPQMTTDFPAMASAGLPGMSGAFESEAAIFGVPESLVAAELPPGTQFRATDPNQPVPVLVSAYFLDIYNLGIAEANRLPKLSERAAIGLNMEFLLGETTIGMGSRAQTATVRGRIIGLTHDPNLMGLVVPLDVMANWNRHMNRDYQPRYIRIMVDAESPAAALALKEQIDAMGLRTTMAAEDLERYGQGITAAELTLAGLLVAILSLAGVGIGSTVAMSTRERRAAWGIQRAMGMKPATLVMLVASEGILIGAICGGIAATLCAIIAAWSRNQFGEVLDTLAFLPGDPLALGLVAYGGIAVLCAVLVVLPLAISALLAARQEPIRLLGERSL